MVVQVFAECHVGVGFSGRLVNMFEDNCELLQTSTEHVELGRIREIRNWKLRK